MIVQQTNKTTSTPLSGRELERWIEAERVSRNLVPVRLHHHPRWLPKALRQGFDLYGRNLSNDSILFYVVHNVLHANWLDHWGSAIHDGDLCFVSEPYLNPNDLDSVREFADRAGLTFENYGEAKSWWYPDRTTRLVFRQEQS